MRRGLLAAAILLAPPVAAGPAVAAPAVHTVIIDKMKFGPLPANLHAGDVILWVNRDLFRHSATARDGSFNLDLAPRTSGRTPVRRKGAIPFFCKFHPAMKGVLVSR
jgi:plastocyanin